MFKPIVSFALLLFTGLLALSAAERMGMPKDEVWSYSVEDFSVKDYRQAVEAALRQYERSVGRDLMPGEHGRVALKLYTNSGAGLATPRNLTRAVIAALEARGYARENIILYDLYDYNLRAAGYLPPRSIGGSSFEGAQVSWLRGGKHYDSLWFYDNPLPAKSYRVTQPFLDLPETAVEEDRKSFLPIPLLSKVDFWINLPMVSDLHALGVNGSLANVTLWNASNTKRFLESPANAPVAVAEMAAIPELQRGWILTLLTLERYQFIAGPHFNSLYTHQEPYLLMSANPVALDYLMYEKMNALRVREGLPEIETLPLIFDYAKAIGLGEWEDIEQVRQ